MLDRSICERCLRATGMDLDDEEDRGGLRFETYWNSGQIPCPPDFLLIPHESALQCCSKRGTHEGAALLSGERDPEE